MTIATNSYGSTAGVAALTPRYATALGVFDTTTRPTLATVEEQINEISGLANVILSEVGLTVPIVQPDAKLALDIFVNEEVAAIVEGINGSGRFGPTTKEPGRSRFRIIMDDLQSFVSLQATGFINLGVPSSKQTTTIGYSAAEYDHLFTRDQFGRDR